MSEGSSLVLDGSLEGDPEGVDKGALVVLLVLPLLSLVPSSSSE